MVHITALFVKMWAGLSMYKMHHCLLLIDQTLLDRLLFCLPYVHFSRGDLELIILLQILILTLHTQLEKSAFYPILMKNYVGEHHQSAYR